jgi:long-subunit acyl-CoA synthetase (AMP-forming)
LEEKLRDALDVSSHSVRHTVVVGEGSWAHLLAKGRAADGPTSVAGSCLFDVSTDDAATLIYTSGTTSGPPKGVALSHRSILTVVGELAAHLHVRPDVRLVSYLPMARIAERVVTHYLPIVVGAAVVCCPDADDRLPVLNRVEPEIVFALPRLCEKLREFYGMSETAGLITVAETIDAPALAADR